MTPILKEIVLFAQREIFYKCGPNAYKHHSDCDLAFWQCLKIFIIS